MPQKRLQLFGSLGAAFLFLFASSVFAFTGPAVNQQPGEGGGALYVDSLGNLGVGTTNPTELFTISSTTPSLFSVQRIGYDRFGFYQSVGTGLQIYNYTDNRTDIFIDGSGNVGINTTAPSSTLHVVGSTRTSSGFYGNGANITSLDPANTIGGPFSSANYAFPLSLGVGTSTTSLLPQTLSVYGTGYVSGNMGIGIAPTAPLHVYSNTTDGILLQGGPSGSNTAKLKFQSSAGNGGGEIFADGSNDGITFIPRTGAGNGANKFYFHNSGVALNSGTNEQDFLKIAPYVAQSGVGYYKAISMNVTETSLGSGQSYLMDLQVGGASKFSVTNSGSVSIGTSTQPYKLYVQGPIYSTGSSTAASFCLQGVCQTSWGTSGQWTDGAGGIYYQPKVSVGTTTLNYPLFVSTSSDSLFAIQRTGATYPTIFKQGTDGVFVINNANGDTLTLKNGNVGIGTTTPSHVFEVQSSGSAANLWMDFPSGAGYYPRIGTNFGAGAYMELYNGATGHWSFSNGYGFDFGTGKVTISNMLAVGTTTAPSYAVDVNGDINVKNGNYYRINTNAVLTQSSGDMIFGWVGRTDSGYVKNILQGGVELWANNAARLSVASSGMVTIGGNIGIATTTPSYPLDVVGTAQFSQPILVGTPTANGHAVNKSYLDSALSGISSSSQWTATSTGIYYNSGSVGVGTASPTGNIHIYQKDSLSATSTIPMMKLERWSNNSVSIGFGSSIMFLNQRAAGNQGYSQIEGFTGNSDAQHLAFGISGLRIADFSEYGSTIIGGNTAGARLTLSSTNHATKGTVTVGGVSINEATRRMTVGSLSGYSTENPILVVKRFFSATPTFEGMFESQLNYDQGYAGQGQGVTFKFGAVTSTQFGAVLEDSTGGSEDAGFVFRTIQNGGAMTERIRINSGGYIGIATTTPSYPLDVFGTAQFSQPILVGAPITNGHAVNKGYLDSALSGISSSSQWTATSTGIFYSGGKVGIGVLNPNTLLNIQAGAAGSISSTIRVYNPGATTGTGNRLGFALGANTNDMAFVQGYWTGGGGTNMGLQFGAGGTTASDGNIVMTLFGAPDKRVGIGTVSPSQTFHVVGTSTFIGNVGIGTTAPSNKVDVVGFDNSGAGVSLALRNTSTVASYAIYKMNVGSGNDGGMFFGTNSAGENSDYGIVNGITFRAGLNTQDIGFSVGNTVGGTGNGPSLIVKSTGYIGIATTTPSYTLDVVGTGQFSQPILVGTPITNGHAVNKGYLDSALSGISSSSQWTAGTAGAIYYNGGNVGIGTSTPANNLHVIGTAKITGNTYLGAGGNGSGLVQISGNTLTVANSAGNSGLTIVGGATPGVYGNAANIPVLFGTNAGSVELMRLTSDGKLGIGTSTPAYKLHTIGAGGATEEVITATNNANNARISLGFSATNLPALYTNGNLFLRQNSGNFEVGQISDTYATFQGSTDSVFFATGGSAKMAIVGANVGIGTIAPSSTLHVVGAGQFSQPVAVGTPIANDHAVTKSYVDGLFTNPTFTGTAIFDGITVSGTTTLNGSIAANGAFISNINMNGNNITGVNKLTVSTIDPVYNIGGQKYATYVSDSIGIKVVTSGKGSASTNSAYIIDFKKAAKGSDEWLFWQTIHEGNNMADVTVLLTPEGTNAALWYELKPNVGQVLIHSSKTTKFSYQLSAPRHDANEWGNITNTEEKGITLPLK